MNTLDIIIQQKQREVSALYQFIAAQSSHPIKQILVKKKHRHLQKSFKQILRQDALAIIGEIKRKSPSKGKFADINDPLELAKQYIAGGANAISVLTDQQFFNGHIKDLIKITNFLQHSPQAVLQKDFIIDEIQIAEAITAGADAILTIVLVLGKKLKKIIQAAKAMGIEVVAEVNNPAEIEMAIEAGAEIIAVNNRDLTNFTVDTQRAFNLVSLIPKNIVKVAASGILQPELVKDYAAMGYEAVLIGEALVTAPDPGKFIKLCRA